MKKIYISLGSNLGDRAENLRSALVKLSPELLVKKVSPLYETEPLSIKKQPKFLNAVAEATTELSALDVLKKFKSIEKEMGEHEHNRPRIIDLDLLFYENEQIDTPELQIPHPRIAERAFVLVPMADIAPEFMHPVLKLTISALKSSFGDTTLVVKRTDTGIFPAC